MEKIALFESRITSPFGLGKRKCWLCRQRVRKGLGVEGGMCPTIGFEEESARRRF